MIDLNTEIRKVKSYAPGFFRLALFPFSGINVKKVFLLL
jgi:hypothetical protein